MLQSSLRPYHQEVTKTSEHARNYGGGNPACFRQGLTISEFRRSCKKVKKKKRPMVVQLHFLKQLSCKPSHSSGELGTAGCRFPSGKKKGEAGGGDPSARRPAPPIRERGGRGGRAAAPAHAPPLQRARAASGLFANRFESVLWACPGFPRVSPVVPRSAPRCRWTSASGPGP